MDELTMTLFQERTRDRLADIETDLLDIEDAGDDLPLDLVGKVLKAAQSIKGGACFIGLEHVSGIAGRVEQLLDMMRNRQIMPEPDVVNAILGAFDLLEKMVVGGGSGDEAEYEETAGQLEGLIDRGLLPEEREMLSSLRAIANTEGRVVFTVSEQYLRQASMGGNFIYLVEYDLIRDVHDKGQTPFELMDFLERSGMVLDCRLDMEAAGLRGEAEGRHIPLYLLFATILEPEMVKAIFDLDERCIMLVQGEEEDDWTHSAAPGQEQAEGRVADGPSDTGGENVMRGEAGKTDARQDDDEKAMEESLRRAHKAWEEEYTRQSAPAGGGDSDGPDVEASPGPETPASAGGGKRKAPEGPFVAMPDGDRWRLNLTGPLTIDRAGLLQEALVGVLKHGTDVVLEAEGVDKVDLAGLQVLWAAFRKRNMDGPRLLWASEPPPALVKAARSAGYNDKAGIRYGLDMYAVLPRD